MANTSYEDTPDFWRTEEEELNEIRIIRRDDNNDEDDDYIASNLLDREVLNNCLHERIDEEPKNDGSDSEYDNKDLIYNDLEIFCHAIDKQHLVENFKENNVILGQLLDFDENDLINCGIDLVGDRKKILDSIAQMHCEKWVPSSLQDLTSKTLLTSPGIYITLNDINKHIEYIGITMRYLQRQLQCKPEILELGKDYVRVEKISSELEDLFKTTKTTQLQIQALGKQLGKHLEDPLLKPANHIDEKYNSRTKVRQRYCALLLGTMMIIGVSFKLTTTRILS